MLLVNNEELKLKEEFNNNKSNFILYAIEHKYWYKEARENALLWYSFHQSLFKIILWYKISGNPKIPNPQIHNEPKG